MGSLIGTLPPLFYFSLPYQGREIQREGYLKKIIPLTIFIFSAFSARIETKYQAGDDDI